MPAENRFVFVQELASGEERLVLAELLQSGRGRIVSELARVPGSAPESDPSFGTPEDYTRLVASPSNLYAAALSVQLGIDFIDLNISVFDLASGARTLRINEHSFSGTSKATCQSARFDEFVAAETAAGVDPDVIAGYDYSVNVETGSIEVDFIEWSDTGKLVVGYELEVFALGVFLGVETFEFELEPVSSGAPVILSCNGEQRPTTPAPASPLSLATIPPLFAFLPPSSTTYIHHNGVPLRFVPVQPPVSNLLVFLRYWLFYRSPVISWVIARLPWNVTRDYRAAKLVAGYPT